MFPLGPLALPLIMAGIQTGTGLLQRGAANRRRKAALRKMKYDIPSGVTEQVQMARERASQTGLPGEDIIRCRIESDIAGTIEKGESVAETSQDVLGLYQKMQGSKMDMNRQILEKGAQFKSENELQLMKTMGLMADAENQQFHYNRFVPFLSEMGYAGEQAAGGAANIAGGLQTAYSAWNNQFMMDQFKDIYGQGGDTPFQTGITGNNLNANPWMTQTPGSPTELNVPQTGIKPWVDPREPYRMGNPSREQILKYGG